MLADTIKGKICRWIIGNYFEAMFRVIVNRYAELKNSNVSKESFVARHDSLMNEFEKSDGNLTIQSLAKIGKITYGGPLFGSEEYAKLINARHKEVVQVAGYDRLRTLLGLNISYDLYMPGMEEPFHYRLTGDRLLTGPFCIETSTYAANVWAYILTIIIVVIAAGCPFIRRKKKP